MLAGDELLRHIGGMATDGAKQAHYLRSAIDAPVYYTDMRRCIDAAVSGLFREEMRYEL
jgi:predicted aconitase